MRAVWKLYVSKHHPPRADAACFIDFLLILNRLLADDVTDSESISFIFLTSNEMRISSSPLGFDLSWPGLQTNGYHLNIELIYCNNSL